MRCEFYFFGAVTVTSFINISYYKLTLPRWKHRARNSVLLFAFCEQKDSAQMPFNAKCVQTSVFFETSNTSLM